MISRKEPKHITDLIAKKSALFDRRLNNEYGMYVTFGGKDNMTSDVCFRRIESIFCAKGKGSIAFYYFLMASKPNLFKYTKLLTELQAMLKGAFTVHVYRYKKVGFIIKFKQKRHTNNPLALYAYTTVFAMIRAIDGEFYPRWEGMVDQITKVIPIEHWDDVIRYFYLHASQYMGHGVNDDLANILHKLGATSPAGIKAVDKFLSVITYLFNTKHIITVDTINKIKLTIRAQYYFSQTPAYRLLEKLSMEIKKEEKND